MSEKSETIKQREKAQKELLKLKKIQRGEIDAESLKDDDKKIIPKTNKEKLENFLFYNKYKILFAAAMTAVLAIIISSMITTPNYDTMLTIYCYENINDKETEAAGQWAEKYYADANNNGKVEILATNCSFSLDAMLEETVHQRQLKIQSILTEADALLFILDDESLKYLNGISANFALFAKDNIIELPTSFYEALPHGETSIKPNKKRYLCLRTVSGSAIEGKAEENYKIAKQVLEKIKSEG